MIVIGVLIAAFGALSIVGIQAQGGVEKQLKEYETAEGREMSESEAAGFKMGMNGFMYGSLIFGIALLIVGIILTVSAIRASRNKQQYPPPGNQYPPQGY